MDLVAETIRTEVDRVLRSKTFETSEVHRRLLQYLVEKTLSGEAERLKEYTVGLDAFAKPPTYDPRQDSIVRLQVGRLRQKLLAYYQTEAHDDPIRINLPKGGYKLSFEAASPERAPIPSLLARHTVAVLSVVLVAALGLAVYSTTSLIRLKRETAVGADQWSPELSTIWDPFLESSRPLLVCLGTPLFVRFPNFGFFRDPKTNEWAEIEKSDRIAAVRKALGDKDILPWYAFTGTGEASAAFLVSKLLAPRKRDLLLTRSNLLSWQQISDNDLVFVGPPKFNVQLQANALTRDIVVEPNGIRNLKPQAGEPEFLADRIVPGKQSEGTTHALISRTPGLSGSGQFLVMAGNASSDTFAAAEWLTEPLHARELLRHLRAATGEIPRYYQVVLKVEFKQGIPVQTSYVFHHVLKDQRQEAGKK